MITLTDKELSSAYALGECLELVLDQNIVVSVWKWNADEDAWWGIDLVKAPDAIGLLAAMHDGLDGKMEKLAETWYTRDWADVEKYVIDLMAKHSKTKTC